MAVEHARHPVVGLQFHPESVLTEHGYWMLDRFLHGATARVELLPDRADNNRAAPTPAAPPLLGGAPFVPPPVEVVR
jgi:hypothetical protein